jgi:PAS domain S-box-containing protein
MRISMLVSTSVLLLASLGFVAYELVTFRDTMVKSLSTQTEIIGINTVSALLFNDPASATQTMMALRVKPNITAAAIYTADGKLFAKYVRHDGATIFQMPEQVTEKKAGYRFDEGYLFLSQPIVSEGERVGMVYIQSDLGEMEIRMKRYASIVIGLLAISLLTAYWVSSRLQSRISEPILHLARTAKTISEEKNYSIRAIADSRDEVGQLVGTFNEMLTQIQVREDALQKAHDELERRVEGRTQELQQEIIERRRGQDELKRAEAFLNSIVENIPNMIFVKGAKELRFLRLNKAGEELLGCSKEDLIGKNDYDFFPKEQADFFIAKDRQVLKEKNLLDIPEESVQTRSRGTRILHTKKIPVFDEEKRPVYLLGISEDITERKTAEDAIKNLNEDLRINAIRLEAANKELEAFSYSVSHDLRSPLRHLDGFSQILLEDYAEKLDDQGRNYLHQVQEASRRMAQLIDDLLNLSRVTRAELRRETVDLSGIVETVAEALKKEQPDRAVEFVIEKGITTVGDAHLLKVVMDNFLGNSWKYTGKRSQARIEFGRTMRDEKMVCFIRDNGAGFDMTYAHKLFGAFQRLHSPSEFPGTGIGLATAQRIIHRHGGRVWAEGIPDQGATFYFTL